MRVGVSPWAARALSPEALRLARHLDLEVIGPSPFVVRHPKLAKPLRGRDVDALVLRAAEDVTRA